MGIKDLSAGIKCLRTGVMCLSISMMCLSISMKCLSISMTCLNISIKFVVILVVTKLLTFYSLQPHFSATQVTSTAPCFQNILSL